MSHNDPTSSRLLVPSPAAGAATAPGMRGGGDMGLDAQVFNRLLKERIIFLGSPVMDDIANAICAQLLLLAAEDPELVRKDIERDKILTAAEDRTSVV